MLGVVVVVVVRAFIEVVDVFVVVVGVVVGVWVDMCGGIAELRMICMLDVLNEAELACGAYGFCFDDDDVDVDEDVGVAATAAIDLGRFMI